MRSAAPAAPIRPRCSSPTTAPTGRTARSILITRARAFDLGAARPSFAFAVARRGQHPEPLGDRHRLCQRCDVELLHDGMAMRLDGALRRTELIGDLLVELAADHQDEHLALPRRE